ncbi:MAG: sugar transferase [Planctomycetota bacterium]
MTPTFDRERPPEGATLGRFGALRLASSSPGAGAKDASGAQVNGYERFGKRCVDAAFLAVVLPFAALVAAPIALWNLAIFRDPRKVFFLQRRVGHRGRIFWIYKFRTMREASPRAQGAWSIESDVMRTTRFGRFLRNAHLDELPQLLNILKGDMHLVGPRPEMVEVHRWACTEVPGFAQRLATVPGLTGLAQVTQGYTVREAPSYAEKLAIDLEYIRRPSLANDVAIIAKTVPWVLQGRGWGWQKNSRAEAQGPRSTAARPEDAPLESKAA